jgi:acetyl esterase/lipase
VGLMDGKPTPQDTSAVGQTNSKLQCVVAAGTPANLVENAAVVEDDAFLSGFIGDFITPKNPPNSAVYKKLMGASPINYVASGAPPFLLVHAEQDKEIPIAVVEEFEQALAKAGGPVKLIRVPDSDHESTFVGDHATVFTGPMVKWYDQYLKGESKTPGI